MRGPRAEEHLPTRGHGGPGPVQVGHESLADVDRQREALVPIALPHHGDLAAAPVDVLQPQRGHLTGAEPQPGQQRQDRPVTLSDRGSGVAGAQQHRGLFGRQVLRQPGQFPVGGGGHRAHQRGVDHPAQVQEPQQRAQGCARALHRRGQGALATAEHERGHLAGGQRVQAEHIADDPGGQERADQVRLALDRHLGQAPLAGQIRGVVGQHHPNRADHQRRRDRRRRPDLTQALQ